MTVRARAAATAFAAACLACAGIAPAAAAANAPDAPESRREVRVDIDLTQGTASARPMQLSTTYRGQEAGQVRRALAIDGAEATRRHDAARLADAFEGLQFVAPLEVHDDLRSGVLTTLERATIAVDWDARARPGAIAAVLTAPDLDAALDDVAARDGGVAPAAASVDVLNVVVAARLAHFDRIFNERDNASGPGFALFRLVGNAGDVLRVAYHFERRTPPVSPAGRRADLLGLARARNLVVYGVRPEFGPSMTPGRQVLIIEAVLVAIFLLLRWRAARRRAIQTRAVLAENREREIAALHGGAVAMLPLPDAGRSVHWVIFVLVTVMALMFSMFVVGLLVLLAQTPSDRGWLIGLAVVILPTIWLVRLVARHDPGRR